ncbi:MAG: hypothetical protein ACRC1U_00400 [Vibrionaceae bacterium]
MTTPLCDWVFSLRQMTNMDSWQKLLANANFIITSADRFAAR